VLLFRLRARAASIFETQLCGPTPKLSCDLNLFLARIAFLAKD
jgi:hypothetical protein